MCLVLHESPSMYERRCYRRADATLYEESVQRTTDCSPGELLMLHYHADRGRRPLYWG